MKPWRRREPSFPDWWGKTPDPIPYEIHWRDPWPEPWRDAPGGDRAFLVPRSKLVVLAKPMRLAEIRHDRLRLAEIETSVQKRGILHPLIVVVDRNGKVSLLDGHHRLLVAERIHMDALPVVIREGERIRGWGREIQVVLADLLKSEKPSCLRP